MPRTLHTSLAFAFAVAFASSCGGGSRPAPDAAADASPALAPPVDILFVVRTGWRANGVAHPITDQLDSLINGLMHPRCTSAEYAGAHACGDFPDDHPIVPPIASLHIGVITGDLGDAGHALPNCTTAGDDGRLDPIAPAPARAPQPAPGALCGSTSPLPEFLTYDSSVRTALITQDVGCYVANWPTGCLVQQPLEALQRALIEHDTQAPTGSSNLNAGFVRPDAVLAIVVVSDQDDESVRDCTHAGGMPCTDATDVFDLNSTQWASTNINLRFYLDTPGGAQDPTWPLERYVDPSNPSSGWLAIKPGHPERIVFFAITGVPLTGWQAPDGSTEWDQLLGAPGPNGPDDFIGRDSTQAIQTAGTSDPTSMMQANLDSYCPLIVVPACWDDRLLIDVPRTSCANIDSGYYALPSRRIVEMARRFDQSALCDGGPCHNGYVASACAGDYSIAMSALVDAIERRLVPP